MDNNIFWHLGLSQHVKNSPGDVESEGCMSSLLLKKNNLVWRVKVVTFILSKPKPYTDLTVSTILVEGHHQSDGKQYADI